MYATQLGDGTWVWDEERAAWHDSIVAAKLEPLQPRDDGPPRAIFSAGGPASGKSSALEIYDKPVTDHAVWLDPDTFKLEIAEYREMVDSADAYAAHGAHEESSHLAKLAFHEAVARRLDIVLDGTGSKPTFVDRLVSTAAEGYDVHVVEVDLPTDEATERAMIRAFGSFQDSIPGDGRVVPLAYLRLTHREVAQTHLLWRDLAEIRRWVLYSSHVERREAPVEIARRDVSDSVRYRAAVAKADQATT
jgi:hypothetical protein